MNKKRGFSLLDITVYLFLSVVILAITFKIIVNANKLFYENLEESLVINSQEESFHSIYALLSKGYLTNIYVNNNSIDIMVRKDEIKEGQCEVTIKNYNIKKINNNLCINEGNNGYRLLDKDINDFKVNKKGKVIYFTISKGGIDYKWCV